MPGCVLCLFCPTIKHSFPSSLFPAENFKERRAGLSEPLLMLQIVPELWTVWPNDVVFLLLSNMGFALSACPPMPSVGWRSDVALCPAHRSVFPKQRDVASQLAVGGCLRQRSGVRLRWCCVGLRAGRFCWAGLGPVQGCGRVSPSPAWRLCGRGSPC